MAPTFTQSLFIPDILPCPGPARCDFHADIFGSSNDPDEVPKEWRCEKCQKKHPTTIVSRSSISASAPAPRSLDTLPTELLQHITEYLTEPYKTILALTSRTLYAKVGVKPLGPYSGARSQLCTALCRDTPAYAPCQECRKMRPYDSGVAWPLLKVHRKERGIPHSVYAVSEFLSTKLIAYYLHQRETGICSSILTCAGTYRKPWAAHEVACIEAAGFSQDDLALGLPITYESSVRIVEMSMSWVITHTKYTIILPRPWTSLSIAQRYAILRELYLCPHVYASKVQYLDPKDPTYPSDSSIAHWLPYQGPIPEAMRACLHCPSEFRSNFNLEVNGQPVAVFDVWRDTTKSCSDGMSEMAYCKASNNNYGLRLGHGRDKFEDAKPV